MGRRRRQPGVPRCRSEVVVHDRVAVPPALPAPVAAAGNLFQFNNSQGQKIRNAMFARWNQEQVQRNTAVLLASLDQTANVLDDGVLLQFRAMDERSRR
jgi:hypothetical protein